MAVSIQFSAVGEVFLGELNILFFLLEHTQPCIHTHIHLESGVISNTEKKNSELRVWEKLTKIITVRDKSKDCFSYEEE